MALLLRSMVGCRVSVLIKTSASARIASISVKKFQPEFHFHLRLKSSQFYLRSFRDYVPKLIDFVRVGA